MAPNGIQALDRLGIDVRGRAVHLDELRFMDGVTGDFSGRSFVGWRRHVTLASAAHAVVAVTGPLGTRLVS